MATAVLIAITDRPRPGMLLLHRPSTMRAHPGQVAFPGGRLDPGETAVEAALREADDPAVPRAALGRELRVAVPGGPALSDCLRLCGGGGQPARRLRSLFGQAGAICHVQSSARIEYSLRRVSSRRAAARSAWSGVALLCT